MNIFLYELKAARKSIVIWTSSFIGIALLYLSFYRGIANDATACKAVMSSYPPALRALLGVSVDLLTSPSGYYAMVVSFVVLCGAIQAMNLGLSILFKETQNGTVDFLYVKPISRLKIISSKLSAALITVAITDLIYFCAALGMMSIVTNNEFNVKVFVLLNVPLLFIQLIFFSLGAGISAFLNRSRSILPISLSTVFGFYFLGTFVATDGGKYGRLISPFKYFDSNFIIFNGRYETLPLVATAVLAAVGLGVAYFVYGRKDLQGRA